MRWSYQIARVRGIDVKIHVTFLLLVAWFGFSAYGQGGAAAAIEAVTFILLLFLCVLLHEFGHAFAARAFGIRTPDITLLPIGGVARLERIPEKPWQELVVAVAGPAVNVVIGLALLAVVYAKVKLSNFTDLDRVPEDMTSSLMAVNFMLVAFNAIPAFPMDGGRVLRSLLAMKLQYVLATTIAARVGQVLAVGFAIAGFFGNPMLTFIGVFIFMGAGQELAYAKFRADLTSRTVADVAHANFISLPAGISVGEARALADASEQPAFPVVDHSLRTTGLVGANDLSGNFYLPDIPIERLQSPVPRISSSAHIDLLCAKFPAGTIVVVENRLGQIVGLVESPGEI